ncbi:MAG: response regulator [Bacteroidota bacterium]
MDNKQEAFLRELLADFKLEAAEHQEAIISGLLELEKKPPSAGYRELIESVFREVHSLKGAARAVNLPDVERLCQSMENIFHQLKQGSLELLPASFNILFKANDSLNVMLSEVEKPGKSIGANALSQLIKEVETIRHTAGTPQKMSFPVPLPVTGVKTTEPPVILDATSEVIPASAMNNEASTAKDTIRIATSKLGVVLRQAEEFITVKATMDYYIREIQKQQNGEISGLVKEMEQFHRGMSRLVDDLLLDIKSILLHPFSSLLAIVPKIVRDLGKEYDKEIQLSIRGGQIEIDRRILEEMKDPLIHIIRNCVDHGIETATVRRQHNKPPAGILVIDIRQDSGSNVELTIHDDGAGINRPRLTGSAVKSGIITHEEAEKMTDKEVIELIFRSGISTSHFITDISGRGLGMAIVAEKIVKLGGNIVVDSTPGAGTKFSITLPVTLATFRGILVRIGEQYFIVPTHAVERAIRLHSNDIKSVESKQMVLLQGESTALVRLGDVLGVMGRKIRSTDELPFPVLILSLAHKRIAIMIDEILGEHEGLVKDLGPQLVHVRNLAGVTVLGDGRVVPILHIPELMESAIHTNASGTWQETPDMDGVEESHQHSVLVAEDSITSRSLLRNIIESAGYQVKTAVDGMEAFQFLQNGAFDLVVSDVEMPRMNGFELTARIRGSKNMSEIPVILITALETADDRQKGMEAGANAYIIKSSFEQSNLIETIHRLI